MSLPLRSLQSDIGVINQSRTTQQNAECHRRELCHVAAGILKKNWLTLNDSKNVGHM